MRIQNTLGRAVSEFEPMAEGKVGIYVCGPTVQAAPHLGHGRSAVAFDVIRRYLSWKGYEVTYVRNVTDVEDKIIAEAAVRGITTEELAAETASRFAEAERRLGVLEPTEKPKATEHIPEMIGLIEELVSKGLAYPSAGDVYFSVRSLPDYGKLSGRNLDELLAGARVEVDERKRDPADFALWKATKPGEPSWDSPWGPGRPGWHIECSAMARKYLGDTFDLHGGGTDLIFPHHENEIAQSEGATGVPFARYWLHNEMLNLGGEKMAKSTGHIIDLGEALDTFPPLAVRLFYLRAQYRSPLEYSESLLGDAAASYERLKAFLRRAGGAGDAVPDPETMRLFEEAMDEDFNTATALAVVFDAVRVGNRTMDANGDASGLAAAVAAILEVFGLTPVAGDVSDLLEPLSDLASQVGLAVDGDADGLIDALIAVRIAARDRQDWALADLVRDGLSDIGITVEDTADGARWHRS